jgi:HEAT repeat protein
MWCLHLSLMAGILSLAALPAQSRAPSEKEPVYDHMPLRTWAAKLKDKDWSVRERAARAMQSFGPKAAAVLPTLLGMLKEDESWPVRAEAARALSAVAPTDIAVLRALVHAMESDESESVRSSISQALSDMKPKPTALLPDLKELIKHREAQVRKNAVTVFAHVAEPRAVADVLIPALADRNAIIRRWIAKHLGLIHEDITPALRRGLKSEDPAFRAATALALGYRLKGSEEKQREQIDDVLPTVLELLKNKDKDVRESAAETLFLLAGRKTTAGIAGLAEALADRDPGVRRWSALALGEIGPRARAAAPALIKTLRSDPSVPVRSIAAVSLGKIRATGGGTVPALIDALQGPDGTVQWGAAMGLAEMGPRARDALPALREASNGDNEHLRRQADNAIRNIERTTSPKEDERAFEAILAYWRREFPGNKSDGPLVRTVNAPFDIMSLHIPVPQGLETLYEHPFAREFLENHLDDAEPLHRAVAADLLTLKLPILSKKGKLTCTLGGKKQVTCTDYRVEDIWQGLPYMDQ